jgi:hypothetical protein
MGQHHPLRQDQGRIAALRDPCMRSDCAPTIYRWIKSPLRPKRSGHLLSHLDFARRGLAKYYILSRAASRPDGGLALNPSDQETEGRRHNQDQQNTGVDMRTIEDRSIARDQITNPAADVSISETTTPTMTRAPPTRRPESTVRIAPYSAAAAPST